MKGPKPLGLLVRLHRHIDIDSEGRCWIWNGNKLPSGYGCIGKGPNGAGTMLAHRASWIAHRGPIPDGMYVLHKCDVPSCINPEHLFLGTQKDNMHDMIKKGRQGKVDRRGTKNSFAKLTEEQARIIKYDQTKTAAHYARMFGVATITAQQVRSGHSWKHI